MKFLLTCTSEYQDPQGTLIKYPQIHKFCENVKVLDGYEPDVEVEISSLENLMGLMNSVGSIVLSKISLSHEKKYDGVIEIYDDYRE